MKAPLDLQVSGHSAVLTLNNLPANTWTAESLTELAAIIEDLNAKTEVCTLIVRSASDKFFSAGADLNSFADADKATATQMAHLFGRAFEALSGFRGLSIAVINGYAMGGGLEVALACDLRIAEPKALMALPEAKVGLLPCAGGTQNLTHLVGEGWAKRIILCGEQVDATLAEKIGLVEEVVGAGEGMTAALRLAEQTAQQSPQSLAFCKKLIQNCRHGSISQGLAKEREYFIKLFDGPYPREGVQAFLEKRQPKWHRT
ncbi:enoyl-CoA hydratase [Gallaecimonas mangrovi]|uniref:enoyl-CoA hydratase n=1 Tax=Gallaecimonas mangrovi TaxID=2291597 RepID=UPI000E1FFB02|nr:enoyl-CoA hydratase [Gallaecimonas mangrovi]